MNDRYNRIKEKRANLRAAEAAGLVADSHEARLAIVRRIHSGEITPEQGNKELARLKRNAKQNGQVTRDQAYRGGA